MHKIAIVYLGRKGAGNTYSFEMAKALLVQKNILRCVLSEQIENKQQWDALSKLHSDSLKIKYVSTYNNKLQFLLALITSYFKYFSAKAFIKEFKPDCIYFPMLSLLSFFFTNTYKKIPIITTMHDVKLHLGEESILITFLHKKVIQRSQKVIVLSRKFISDIHKLYGTPVSNIFCIPHANFDYYVPDGYFPQFEKLNNNILFFGRIHRYKGLEVLLRAMELVIRKRPNVHLTIAGNGELTYNEKNLIAALDNNVTCDMKWIQDNEVYTYFVNTDFTIIPYIEASQSGVIPLSYSFGKTVIASDIGGLSEQIIDDCGILLPPGDIEKLADAIILLYENPCKLIDLNKKSYHIANSVLTWSHSATLLSDLIAI